MSEVVIVADQVEMVAISDLKTSKNKVKEHSVDQVAMLAGMMQEFGFTVPILIDAHNEVIAGRGRLLAAIGLHLEEVPCVRTNHLSEAQIQALIIADNKIAESPWDIPNLKMEMEALKEIDAELLSITGFDFEEIDELLEGQLTEESDDGEDDPKVDFLSFGSHKVELEKVELRALNGIFSDWAKRHGSYRGLIPAVISACQNISTDGGGA